MPYHVTLALDGVKAEAANAATGVPASGFVTVSFGDDFSAGAFAQVSGPLASAVRLARGSLMDGFIAPPACTIPIYAPKADAKNATDGSNTPEDSVTVSLLTTAGEAVLILAGQTVQLQERVEDILGAVSEGIVDSTPV